MYIVLFLLFLFGFAFHEIISPFTVFFEKNQIAILIAFLIIFMIFAICYGKKHKSIGCGIGIFLASSQFWFFVLIAFISIAEFINGESDVFLSSIISIIVGALVYAYAVFNYKMLRYANEEANGNPLFHITVGIVGWVINALILF